MHLKPLFILAIVLCIAAFTVHEAVGQCVDTIICKRNDLVCAKTADGLDTQIIGICDLENLQACDGNPRGWKQTPCPCGKP